MPPAAEVALVCPQLPAELIGLPVLEANRRAFGKEYPFIGAW